MDAAAKTLAFNAFLVKLEALGFTSEQMWEVVGKDLQRAGVLPSDDYWPAKGAAGGLERGRIKRLIKDTEIAVDGIDMTEATYKNKADLWWEDQGDIFLTRVRTALGKSAGVGLTGGRVTAAQSNGEVLSSAEISQTLTSPDFPAFEKTVREGKFTEALALLNAGTPFANLALRAAMHFQKNQDVKVPEGEHQRARLNVVLQSYTKLLGKAILASIRESYPNRERFPVQMSDKLIRLLTSFAGEDSEKYPERLVEAVALLVQTEKSDLQYVGASVLGKAISALVDVSAQVFGAPIGRLARGRAKDLMDVWAEESKDSTFDAWGDYYECAPRTGAYNCMTTVALPVFIDWVHVQWAHLLREEMKPGNLEDALAHKTLKKEDAKYGAMCLNAQRVADKGGAGAAGKGNKPTGGGPHNGGKPLSAADRAKQLCTFCKRFGHLEEKCFDKHPELRNQRGTRGAKRNLNGAFRNNRFNQFGGMNNGQQSYGQYGGGNGQNGGNPQGQYGGVQMNAGQPNQQGQQQQQQHQQQQQGGMGNPGGQGAKACYQCGQVGHIARNCRNTAGQQQQMQTMQRQQQQMVPWQPQQPPQQLQLAPPPGVGATGGAGGSG